MKLYRRILRYLLPYKGLFLLAMVAMVAFGALDAFSFTLLIPFLDALFNGARGATASLLAAGKDDALHRVLRFTIGGALDTASPMTALRNVVLVIFGVMLLKNVADYVRGLAVVYIEQRVTRDLRNELYEHLLRLGLPFHHRTRAGQVISRITSDVDQLRALVTSNLAEAMSAAMRVVFLVVGLFLVSWKLTLVMLTTLPLMLGIWERFRKRLHRGVRKVLDAAGEISSHIQETVSGIRLVKASAAEDFETERFRRLTRAHYKAVIRNDRWRKVFPPMTEMVGAMAVLALLWYGSRLVLVDHSLEAPAFLAFLGLAMSLMQPVKVIGKFPSQVQPGFAAAERAFELLDTPPDIVDRPDAREPRGIGSGVRVERVSFRYVPDEPCLEGIDLEIRPGEVVALVGPSGSGKTTLASLLPRFYDPTGGRITLDGVDLRELKGKELRRLMGIVTQETTIFHDTVRANIAYGLDDVPHAVIEAAARAANAHGFIAELPAGYDTVLGERGTRLSGGQRQRIAIARALARNPQLLILDEATSALDTESERLVQEAIDSLLEGRTVLVIAHRLSTVRRADQILVMDGGRVVQRGTHEELLATGGLYRRLYELQFQGDDAALRVPATGA
ncbi:MAG TPA: ABC transporter ATP-binding protein [Longimicrobiales bacterium]|nr:ABC transporter ATP-binding protein [Longimicrobiales bacterium]